jgi:hypothetical protein
MKDIAASGMQPAPAAATEAPLGSLTWLREGLRAAFLLSPRVGGARVRPRELLAIALLTVVVEIGVGRLEIEGPADFSLRGWLAPWWALAAILTLVWALLWPRQPQEGRAHGGAANWLALWLVAALPPGLLSQALDIAQVRELLPEALDESGWLTWGAYLALWVWTLAIALRLGRSFGLDRRRLALLAAGLVVIFGITAWQFPDQPWEPPPADSDEAQGLALSQESFEAQQALFDHAVEALAPRKAGKVNVYGIVFAPYALQNVFLNESTLVADLLAQRFDAKGRVLQLVNHPATVQALPWATPLNLKRAIEAVAQRMDREHDLLVIYLTSHGAQDFQLEASLPPLDVDSVSPGELRVALDEAGIRYRVIAISACFSGGWVGPLASDTTLVMTAADALHTSYGCGARSELTYFGRAVFGEALRHTHSFEQAFAQALPVIRQREQEARKPDGFSNPQISVGEGIRPVLAGLQRRLDAVARP